MKVKIRHKKITSLKPKEREELLRLTNHDDSLVREALKNRIDGKVFIAEHDGKMIAQAVVTPWCSTITGNGYKSLLQVFVLREYRRKGIGSQLVKTVKNHCIKNNMYGLRVQAFDKIGAGFFVSNNIDEVHQEFLRKKENEVDITARAS